MPLGYNVEHMKESGGEQAIKEFEPDEPGVYKFKVDEFTETEFKTGRKGAKVKLLVDTGKREATVYENVFYEKDMLWKLRSLFRALEMDPDQEYEIWDVENKLGEAEFDLREYNGKKMLSVKKFINALPTDPAAPLGEENKNPLGSDDVPF